jgi:hypothetical protein
MTAVAINSLFQPLKTTTKNSFNLFDYVAFILNHSCEISGVIMSEQTERVY